MLMLTLTLTLTQAHARASRLRADFRACFRARPGLKFLIPFFNITSIRLSFNCKADRPCGDAGSCNNDWDDEQKGKSAESGKTKKQCTGFGPGPGTPHFIFLSFPGGRDGGLLAAGAARAKLRGMLHGPGEAEARRQ